ncbi:MAG: 2-amino-4-hydroxy-6-hydroxymethyldihydropteridine diphosphokinase [Bacteroidaceae bacterium]|nr:2-amino-4-hydroxy-6-hydroxymethyldihydropteridine diphosphokinase [Bacteroidaceae bacterium]
MHRAYLGLGTNLGDRAANLDRAIALLQQQVGPLVKCSCYLSSEPWGFTSDNDFLNAAASFDTSLSPLQLLRTTQEIEQQMGRTAKSVNAQYADRIIDIDILLYDTLQLTTPELTIPHPLMAQRDFVLRPLAEIAPRKRHPVLRKTIAQLLTTNSKLAPT